MNAGAFDLNMENIVKETCYMDYEGNIKTLVDEEHNFGYRKSFFTKNEGIIIYTVLKLRKVDKEEQLNKMNEIWERRKFYQPLEYPSAGSTFKRGETYIASLLIDQCGLKGTNVGDAYVSEKHAGFIINKGKAKAKEILELVEIVKEKVQEIKNVLLEMEVIIVGE